MSAIAAPRARQSVSLELHLARYGPIYYLTMCAIAVAAAWLPRLQWGFWTDEAGSFWMAGGGWWQAIANSEHFPGQSLFYGGLLSFFHHPGSEQELWLRIPSMAGVIAATYFLFRLTEALAGPGTGFLAALPFLCTPAVIDAATNARPYGLALAAAIGSCWKFHEFVTTGRRRSFIEYIVCSVLVLYLQYFFAFLFLPQLAVLVYRQVRGERVPWAMVAAAAGVLALAVIPLRESLLVLLQFARSAYATGVRPTASQLFLLCFPVGPLLAAAVACIAIAFLFPRSWKLRRDVNPNNALLIATWWLAAPLLSFLAARFTKYDLFATRYLLFATPAFFVALAWLISCIRPVNHRLLVLFAIVAGTVLHPGNLLKALSGPQEDWRGPVATVREWSGLENPPIFVGSGLAESNRLNWQAGARRDSFILAALTAYPIRNPTFAVPFQFTPEVPRYVRAKLDGELARAPRVMLLAADGSGIIDWMRGEMKSRGYTDRVHEETGYTLTLFKRSP